MSLTIRCSCGTTLRAPDSAAGKDVACPKCQKMVRVPGEEPEKKAPAPARPAPTPARPTPPTAAPASILINCTCGAKMKVAAESVGKTVACPKCQQQSVVTPDGGKPVVVAAQPAMPAVPPEPEADIFDSLPDAFGGPAASGGLAGGGFGAAAPPPAYRKAPKKKRKPGATSAAGTLVAIIGVGIMALGLAICCLGLAGMHYLSIDARISSNAVREKMANVDPAKRFTAMRESAEARKAFFERSQSIQKFFKYAMKIGRTVLAVGGVVAVVGYGISIATPGAQMGLAIAALIVGLISGAFDLFTRVIPWLSDKDDFFKENLPNDIFGVMSGRFGFHDNSALDMAGLEFLMAGHLLLFAVYALIGYVGRKKRDGSGLAITAIATAAGYMFLVLVLAIMISDPGKSESFLYMLIAVYWIANGLILTSMGTLITALAKLR